MNKLNRWTKYDIAYAGSDNSNSWWLALYKLIVGRPEAYFEYHADDLGIMLIYFSSLITRADRKKSLDEIKYIRKFLEKHYGEKMANSGMELFEIVIKQPYNMEDMCAEIEEYVPYRVKAQLMYYLYGLAMSDGSLHRIENRFLKLIAYRIGIKDKDRDIIAGMHGIGRKKARKKTNKKSRPIKPGKYFTSNSAYSILGIPSSSTVSEIKAAYRKLVKIYHPDKAQILGERRIQDAREMFDKIQKAYEKLQRTRSFS